MSRTSNLYPDTDIYVDGHMLHVRDTCSLYHGDIITVHLCHGRLVSLCIQMDDGRQTDDVLIQSVLHRPNHVLQYLLQDREPTQFTVVFAF